MSFKVVSARLTASPNSMGWSQVHEFAPQDTEKLKIRGQLFAVISTRSLNETKEKGQTIDSVSAGREVLSRLHEEYFGKTAESSFETLKKAVYKVVKEFESGQSAIEIVAVASVSGVIYAAATGGAQLTILRNGNLAKILVSRGKEVVAASGYPKKGDVLTLGTSAFYKSFSEGIIRGALGGRNIRKAAESFAPEVHASSANPDLGVVFLTFKEADDNTTTIKDIGTRDEPPIPTTSVRKKGLEEKLSSRETAASKVILDKEGVHFDRKSKNILGKLKEVFGVKGRSLYIKEAEEPLESRKRRKVSASVGIILVLTLVVSVFFGIQQKSDRDYRLQYESELKEAEHLLDESLSLYTIDTGRSRGLFNQARSLVDGLITSGIEDPELDGLDAKIKEKQGEILGEYKVQVESFSDLTIITSGFSGKSVVDYGEEIYVLDDVGERIVSISVAAKKSKVEVGPAQLSGVRDFTVYNDRIFVIDEDGIFEVSKTSKEEIAKKDWLGDALLFAYTSNLYLLEKNASDISRYVSTESGFAERKSWLSEDMDASISEAVGWVIDGTIWVLEKDGSINRFSQGNRLSFSIKGLAPELVSGDAIYTSENTKNLYILDSQGKRVVVADKDGNFIAQYLADEIKGAKDLVVSESEGKTILLKDGKLLSFELKHLN